MFQIKFLCDFCCIKWEQWYIFHGKWVSNFQLYHDASVGLNSVRREILTSVTIDFYDKVWGRNKAQRWLLGDFSFEKDTIGHNFTGQYYGLHKLHFNKAKIMSFCTRPTRWVGLHSTSSLKQRSTDKHVSPLGHIILIPASELCFYSLMMCAEQRCNTHQFYRFWFDLTGTRTHGLPHWRWAR